MNQLNLSSSFCINIKGKGAAMKIKRNVDNEEHYQERCYIVIDTQILWDMKTWMMIAVIYTTKADEKSEKCKA